MTTVSITHPQLVAALVKKPQDILLSLTLFATDLWHGATGVAGETGELLEAILFPAEGGPDRVNLREEMGDIYFYMEQIVQRSGIKLDFADLEEGARNMVPSGEGHLFFAAAIAVHGSQVLDTIKKVALYNKELDTELLTNQMRALGMSMLAFGHYFSIDRQECLNANILKLSKRYSSLSYSDQQAQDRADKVQPQEGVIPERKPFKGEPTEDDVKRGMLGKDA